MNYELGWMKWSPKARLMFRCMKDSSFNLQKMLIFIVVGQYKI